METVGFLTIISSPVWMAFVCLYAMTSKTRRTKRLLAAAVVILICGHVLYGLSNRAGIFFSESFVVLLATFVSAVLALWGLYSIRKRPSPEDAVLHAAEALARQDERSR